MMETKHHIRYGSVCSGVEAATLAWAPLGWECKFVSEVEPFPCAVLQQRFDATKPLRPLDPEEASDDADRAMRKAWGNETNKLPDGGTLPNLGDFTKIRKDDYDGDIDLLVGGTPCQDLSIAGQRAGFEGARSGLAIDFVRLAYELGTRWLVWENVPGALSSNGGGAISQHYYQYLPDAKLECPREVSVQPDLFAMLEETDSDWPGECWTLNMCEFPNFQGRFRSDGDVSSLSDILVVGNIPSKYYLTAKCAEGILRRAERRGKELPPVLKVALERQMLIPARTS